MKQKKDKNKKHRIFAVILCISILLTLSGISDISPVAAATGQEESVGADGNRTDVTIPPNPPEESTVCLESEPEEFEKEEEKSGEENTEETADSIEETVNIDYEETQDTETEEDTTSAETDVQEEVTEDVVNDEDTKNSMVMLADSGHHAGWAALTTSDTALSGGNYYLANDVTMEQLSLQEMLRYV